MRGRRSMSRLWRFRQRGEKGGERWRKERSTWGDNNSKSKSMYRKRGEKKRA